jgi:hypothetical protein
VEVDEKGWGTDKMQTVIRMPREHTLVEKDASEAVAACSREKQEQNLLQFVLGAGSVPLEDIPQDKLDYLRELLSEGHLVLQVAVYEWGVEYHVVPPPPPTPPFNT